MVQQVKVFTAGTNNLSSVTRTHMVERRDPTPTIWLLNLHAQHGTHVHTSIWSPAPQKLLFLLHTTLSSNHQPAPSPPSMCWLLLHLSDNSNVSLRHGLQQDQNGFSCCLICIFSSMLEYLCMQVHSQLCANSRQSLTTGGLLTCLPPYFLRQGLSLEPEAHHFG